MAPSTAPGTQHPAQGTDTTLPAIVVDTLVKRFGTFTAVNGVSFTVADGEIFGLLGPNGAGKSTLIRMLTTLLPPTSGSARVFGHDVAKEPDEVRKSIGVIPQAMTSDLELSVEENLLIYAKLYSVPPAKRTRLIKELLAAVELTDWADKQVKFLSGGMRRRVEIARGLVHEPRVFFLDEPTTGLDPVSRVAVWEMLQRIKGERNLTVLVTTHYMDEADKLCDRIAIVDHGELKALDSPLKLKASIPGRNVLEVSFSTTRRAGSIACGSSPRRKRVRRRPRGPRGVQPRPDDDARADGGLVAGRRHDSVTVGAEHDARRRVRALRGPGAQGRAAGAVGSRALDHGPRRQVAVGPESAGQS
jgi:ABC-2 type transport system ATP-binding protein